MDCAEEVSLLRRELSGLPGIRDLSFDAFHGRMTVRYDAASLTAPVIESAVASLGMRAEPWQDAPPEPGFRARHGRLLLTLLSGAAVLAGLIWSGLHSGNLTESLLAHHHDATGHALPWPVRTLFVLAVVLGSYESVPRAWASVKRLRPDMNALVLFSVAGAMFLGEWAEAGTLAFLYSLATRLESWSMTRARDAVGKLLRVTPRDAALIESHGDHEHERRVDVGLVTAGSLIRVRPGERVPVDGLVETGVSYVNQALVTGESVPIQKEPGDRVYAGTLNEEGMIDVRSTAAAQDTVLARMTRMVGDSQTRRAPIERFVERFTRYYTPAVFAAAALVMVALPLVWGTTWSHAFYQGMVVLLISCPCGLVISTPVTVAAALASAARRGVLIKGGAFLEEAARVRAIAFDKTGVLTAGVPTVERMVTLEGREPAGVLKRLAGLERSSEHPLARAIEAFAANLGVTPSDAGSFRSLPGLGAEAQFAGDAFWAGSLRLARSRGLWTPEADRALAELGADERAIVTCGTEESLWALLAVSDPPRPEAPQVVADLRALGIERITMLTGDGSAAARMVARRVGIDEFQADLLPQEKEDAVAALRSEFQHAAMIGDGLNDAQALARATLGISFGRAHADVSMETADIVLMPDDLRAVPFLFEHARHARRVIIQNIVLALLLKALFLILASAGWATLWMAVAADMGGTFLVTANGLRLLAARGTPAAANQGQ